MEQRAFSQRQHTKVSAVGRVEQLRKKHLTLLIWIFFFFFFKAAPKNHRWHSRKGAVNWWGRINDIQIAGSTRHNVPSWGRDASRAEVYRLGLLNRYVNTNTDSGHVDDFWKIVAIIFHCNLYAFLYITSTLILNFSLQKGWRHTEIMKHLQIINYSAFKRYVMCE